ncbi:hypothetical protein BFP72_14945 [Reichenbachiella sp. 5M10]|uniref:DapH/DapD/GlmU-related protein n=1 Tax=Reichenbachiella sp. 5M10 TaxID=1889772 RepID=UPI000C15B915|nr:DapH/DapD/GlmU-related protein [Reichenbachiella sp. 5M10]PIB36605.1 hypothetical protein BFP72_14945 [Reichenbachiella sp. 5M10]
MKALIRRLLIALLHKSRFLLTQTIQQTEKETLAKTNANLLHMIKSKGCDIKLNGSITITHPLMVTLGNNVHLGDNTYIHSDGGVVIGDNTHISRNLVLYTSNHQYEGSVLPYDESRVYKPVRIEKNVWIGMNVCITPGVTIGEGAIIGLGTVVTKDVPAFSIVGNAPQRIIKSRNQQHYNSLVGEKNVGGVNGQRMLAKGKNAFELGSKLFFVVGTGRCGSKALADTLNQHPSIECLHEPKGELIKLSTDYAHGILTREETRKRIVALYDAASNITTEYYGESDQKISNLIDIYHDIFPKAKFIWCLREAKPFVSSAYGRGWFDDREFSLPYRARLSVESIYSSTIYSQNRINGHLADPSLSKEEWKTMSPFERNCWYWQFWNTMIEMQLGKVSNSFTVRIEELDLQLESLVDSIGASSGEQLNAKTSNSAKHQKKQNWSQTEYEVYTRWCSTKMNEWYGK